MENTALELSTNAKAAFSNGDFEEAAKLFQTAVERYTEEGKSLEAAEAKNNLSVALLQAEHAEESLEAARGTDAIFAEAGDKLRQAMALGNQAAALEALDKLDEALGLYENSVVIFEELGEKDYQSTVLKSIAGIKLRKGKLQDTAQAMLGSLGTNPKPNIFQRILKFFLRLIR